MSRPTCFIAMPLTTAEDARARYHGDADHFVHVLEHLFVPAVEAAGFAAIKPIMSGADVIQGQIIKHLEEADMVLCDISSHNPNVFFELGIRTALDRPIALVRDNHTSKLPFDTSIVNTHTYNSALQAWTIDNDKQMITQHIISTHESTPKSNALWGYFGLTQRASERLPSDNPLDAKLDLLISQISNLGQSPPLKPIRDTWEGRGEFANLVLSIFSLEGIEVRENGYSPRTGYVFKVSAELLPETMAEHIRLLALANDEGVTIINGQGLMLLEVRPPRNR